MNNKIINESNHQDNSNADSNNIQPQQLNILSEKFTKINEKFIIKFTKETIKSVDRDAKRNCKVASFSADLNLDELQSTLNNLKLEDYPNLFTFIINLKDVKFNKTKMNSKFTEIVDKVQKSLSKFSDSRPLVLQLTSEDKNVTNFFYKTQNSSEFNCINQEAKNFKKFLDFPTFLCSFLDGLEIKDLVPQNLSQLTNSSLILRFLRIFQFSQEYFDKLVLASAAYGTKKDFLAAIDAPFEGDGRLLTYDAMRYISNEFKDVSPEIPATSVLLTATEHKNTEVIDYLITYWSHLIQELPANHQMQISTAAFKSDQLDVLCDMLDIVDFPFPEDYEFDDEQEHKKLRKITLERMAFSNAIKKENFEKINGFIDNHLSLKNAYSIDNELALIQAIELKKFGVFYYLKSLGFYGKNCEDILKDLDKEDCNKALEQAVKQRKANVNQALVNVHKSVMLLATRSLIHNRRISKEQEAEYRQKIINWLQDIQKIAPEMLDVAASCEYLKIIFDFESDTVENASLAGPNSLGSAYSVSKWIFVGAKPDKSDKKREQQIKGVLAHELCHYVMRLVYENQENPYYEDREDIKEIFERIVRAIDIWSARDEAEHQDDECNGTISSVFTSYKPEDSHPELIVRVVQILTEFDDDEEKTRHLQEKYQNLFGFWHNQVIPELQKYLQKNQDVKKLNGIVELLPKILEKGLKIKETKGVGDVIGSKLAVITTNIPTLLFVDICEFLQQQDGILMDSKNLFAEPEKLNNVQVWNQFKQICRDVTELNIFVDCTNGVPDYLDHIFVNNELSFIFVVSKNAQFKELMDILDKSEMKDSKEMEVNYDWNDLTVDSQELLLETSVNFQNNSQFSFYDLFDKIIRIEDDEPMECDQQILQNFSEIVDDQLLNALVDNQPISINSKNENEKYFTFLYQKRSFRRERKDEENKNIPENDLWTEDELIAVEVESTYVLISDMAGNGKSWAMKNFTKILCELNPTSWVTYVDLKQYIKEFKAQEGQEVMPEFSSFMAEKILRTEHKFESKIFQKLYKDGKIFILFDGFDEIAPNYAEFVSNLAKSFQSNGGNQLWIATRDYFEVNLMEKLQLKTVFKLIHFKDEENVEQIVRLWMVNDYEKQDAVTDLNDFTKNSQNTKNYHKLAEKVYEKMSMRKYSWLFSLGGPQINKMVADISKNDKTAVLDLRYFQIFEKFIQNLYENWAYCKGQLRKVANIKSQNLKLNFWKFHQYAALKFFFPDYLAKFYPNYDGSEWIDEEVISCGLISNPYGFQAFTHKSFGEFFIADLILKHLKESAENGTFSFFFNSIISRGPKECTIFIFVDVLTDSLGFYDVIRMLINEGIDDLKVLDGIKPKMSIFMVKFESMKNFGDYFTKNLDKLVDFVTEILKNGSYGKVKEILSSSAKKVIEETENMEMYVKFQTFMFEFLKPDDLKDLIVKQELLQKMLKHNPSLDILEDFLMKIEAKFGPEFIKEIMQFVTSVGTLLHFLCKLPKKTQIFMKILKKYLNNSELIKLTKISNSRDESMLHICVRNGNKILWTEIEELYSSENLADQFKQLVMQEADYEQNILDFLPSCHDPDFHIFFWNIFLSYFNSSEDLMSFVQKKNKLKMNFIHSIVAYHRVPIRELTFNILKQNLTTPQYKQVLSTRDKDGRNILQIAAFKRDLNLESHKATWKIVRDSCETNEEFLDILNQMDLDGANILCHAAHCNSPDIIEFMIKEIEKICTHEEMTKFLCSLYIFINKSLLLLASRYIKSLDTHKFLWDMFEKYVEPSKIFEFIQPCAGEDKCHILLCAVRYNNLDVVQFIWEKVKVLIPKKEDQIEYIKVKNCYKEDFQKWSRRNFENPKVYKWVKNLANHYGIPIWTVKEVKQ